TDLHLDLHLDLHSDLQFELPLRANLWGQPSSARFHPPPHPASLRPPRPSASRSPSAAALGFRDK
ncbi:unnamed protein product, partial [Coccothraustes coccothraustes]